MRTSAHTATENRRNAYKCYSFDGFRHRPAPHQLCAQHKSRKCRTRPISYLNYDCSVTLVAIVIAVLFHCAVPFDNLSGKVNRTIQSRLCCDRNKNAQVRHFVRQNKKKSFSSNCFFFFNFYYCESERVRRSKMDKDDIIDFKGETFMEILLIDYRWLVVCFFLLPMSFLYNLWFYTRSAIIFHLNSAPRAHDDKVRKIQQQVNMNHTQCVPTHSVRMSAHFVRGSFNFAKWTLK